MQYWRAEAGKGGWRGAGWQDTRATRAATGAKGRRGLARGRKVPDVVATGLAAGAGRWAALAGCDPGWDGEAAGPDGGGAGWMGRGEGCAGIEAVSDVWSRADAAPASGGRHV